MTDHFTGKHDFMKGFPINSRAQENETEAPFDGLG